MFCKYLHTRNKVSLSGRWAQRATLSLAVWLMETLSFDSTCKIVVHDLKKHKFFFKKSFAQWEEEIPFWNKNANIQVTRWPFQSERRRRRPVCCQWLPLTFSPIAKPQIKVKTFQYVSTFRPGLGLGTKSSRLGLGNITVRLWMDGDAIKMSLGVCLTALLACNSAVTFHSTSSSRRLTNKYCERDVPRLVPM